jgi:Spy/CpxP family protein refolding chaperone
MSLSSRTKAVLLAVGILAAGFVCGAVADRWVLQGDRPLVGPRPGAPLREGHFVRRFARHLDLTEEQQEEIRSILDEGRRSTRDMQMDVRTRMEEVRRTTHSRIREMLTAEQREKFDKMSRRMHRPRRWMRGRPKPFRGEGGGP